MQIAKVRWSTRAVAGRAALWLVPPAAAVVCCAIGFVEFLGVPPPSIGYARSMVLKMVSIVVPVAGIVLVPLRLLGPLPPRVMRTVSLIALASMLVCTGFDLWTTARESYFPVLDLTQPFWLVSIAFVVGVSAWTYIGFHAGRARPWSPRSRLAAGAGSAALLAAIVLSVPLSIALEVTAAGWGARNTFYRAFAFRTGATRFQWTTALLPDALIRMEADYLAGRDAREGRVRFIGVGVAGYNLAGIERASTPSVVLGGRGPDYRGIEGWTCRAVCCRWEGCAVTTAGEAPNPPPVDRTYDRCEIACTNPSGAERRFVAEVARSGCVVTADQAYFNQAVLRRVLSNG